MDNVLFLETTVPFNSFYFMNCTGGGHETQIRIVLLVHLLG